MFVVWELKGWVADSRELDVRSLVLLEISRRDFDAQNRLSVSADVQHDKTSRFSIHDIPL